MMLLFSETPSVFKKIVNYLKNEWKQSRDYIKAYGQLRVMIQESVKDGHFSDEAIAKIEKHMEANGLPRRLLNKLDYLALNPAFEVMKADNKITEQELQDFERIQKFFGIKDSDIVRQRAELNRLRLLAEIQEGRIPIISPDNVLLQKKEVAFCQIESVWNEERVVSREYVGGSHGVSVRVAKGLSYRVGSSRGRLVTKTGAVPVSTGNFVVTNSRLIFSGREKSFQIPYSKIINLQVFADGIHIHTGVGKSKVVIFEEKDGDIVGALVNYAVNQQ